MFYDKLNTRIVIFQAQQRVLFYIQVHVYYTYIIL